MFKEKNIIIITDGGLTMGLGHVYRTLALAKGLSKFSKVKFLTQSGNVVINKIGNSGYEVVKVSSIDELKRQLSFDKPNTLIIDKLNVDEEFAKYIKTNLSARLVIFSNISSANKYADVVVNAVVGTNFKNKSFIDKNTNTLYLKGPKYLVLRDEFYGHKDSYAFRDNLKKILLTFGGGDQTNLTSKVLDRLLSINRNFEINIILGPAFESDTKLKKTLNRHKNKKIGGNIYRDINNVSKLMLDSDLIITSPGMTMFESLYIGIPTIALYQNTFQKNACNDLMMTYDLTEIESFEDCVFTVYRNYYQNKNEIGKLNIGQGKGEIISSIIT